MLKQTLLAFLLYTFTLDSASGKPDGSPDACADHPDHGVNPQKSDNPYTMTKEKNEDSFNIDISSDKGATFKGIMIRAVVIMMQFEVHFYRKNFFWCF
jgi:hypothetical protein